MSQAPVEKPWGSYQVLDEQPHHTVKRIEVRPGHRLSYQRHSRRAEHWFVVTGQAQVLLDDVQHQLQPGHSIEIPRGAAHRGENKGSESLVLIEIQTGDYFGEDDIERLADDYGRVSA